MDVPKAANLDALLASGQAKETARVRQADPGQLSGPGGPLPKTKPKKARRPKGLPKLTEKEFQRQVVEYARLNGWLVYHTRDSRGSESGFPDLVLVGWCRVVFAELKTDTGRLTDAQQLWLHQLRLAGQEACVWRPALWKAVEATIGPPSRPAAGTRPASGSG